MGRVSRFAAAAFMADTVAATGLTVGAGTSTAEGPSYNGGSCPGGMTCTHWCPGDPAIPGMQVLSWDWNICHDWYWNSEGIVDVNSSTIYPWSGAPHQVAPPPPPIGPAPAPLSPAAGHAVLQPARGAHHHPPDLRRDRLRLAARLAEASASATSTRRGS